MTHNLDAASLLRAFNAIAARETAWDARHEDDWETFDELWGEPEQETYDTADAIVTESTAVELLDEDYDAIDPEYERVLGMYANEYTGEISMVDAIDTEEGFDADAINDTVWVSMGYVL